MSQISRVPLELPLDEVRAQIRAGAYSGYTTGLARGYQQCNLVVVAERHAVDFFRYCQRNPKPCPVIGVSDTGDPMLTRLGSDIDVRTDVPLFNVYRDGELAEQRRDISALWRDDFVAFALGCSFSFEHALIANGVPLRHIAQNLNVAMYRTSIPTTPAGRFSGAMVVSMRPIHATQIETVTQICARFPHAHGRPLHSGEPSEIGIVDIARPDWGDAVEIRADERPVFWACGVTPQNALLNGKPEICITHAPGCMLLSGLSIEPET